ncbi:MAG: hypothetical protein DRJ32_03990 [Thermoprotei archaeon]|nr:MAG: hypothetical protein DRJ32_03990 [Thermoprotei archaeon]HDD64296.1 hypothetical protein [Thermoprotei archaeon]
MILEIFQTINIFSLVNLIFAITALLMAILSIYFSVKMTRRTKERFSEIEKTLADLKRSRVEVVPLPREKRKVPVGVSITQPEMLRRVEEKPREIEPLVKEIEIEKLDDLSNQMNFIEGTVIFSSEGMVIDSSGSIESEKIAAYLAMSYDYVIKAGVEPEYVVLGDERFCVMLKLERYGDSDIYAYVQSSKALSLKDIDIIRNSIKTYLRKILRGKT